MALYFDQAVQATLRNARLLILLTVVTIMFALRGRRQNGIEPLPTASMPLGIVP